MPKTAKYVLLFAAVLLASAVCIVLMFRPRAVNIVYMADARYLPYVMVSLESAIASKNKGTQYHVHIIAKDFAPEDTAKIPENGSRRRDDRAVSCPRAET